MKRTIGIAVVALLLGGCAVYADPFPYPGPYPPAAGVYVAPPPVVIAPGHYHYGYHGGWYRGGWARGGGARGGWHR